MRPYLLICLSVLFACQSPAPQIKVRAEQYLHARLLHDFATAATLISPESAENLAALESLSQEIETPSAGILGFEIREISQTEDSAWVFYRLAESGDELLRLAKMNGVWQVLLAEQEVPDAALLWEELHQMESESDPSFEDEVLEMLLEEEAFSPEAEFGPDSLQN